MGRRGSVKQRWTGRFRGVFTGMLLAPPATVQIWLELDQDKGRQVTVELDAAQVDNLIRTFRLWQEARRTAGQESTPAGTPGDGPGRTAGGG